jgi:hypothetical protein
MTLVVAKFKNCPKGYQSVNDTNMISMSTGEQIQFDGIEQSEEYPVMNTVDKHSLEWHGESTKYMHKGSLILSFGIVKQGHNQGPALNLSILLLISKQVENWKDKQWSKILDVEDIVPSDLFAKIFDSQDSVRR